jgi:serine/threonine protein kinase
MKSKPVKVAEGGYGCVFRPSLDCADGTVTKSDYISKAMTIQNAESELNEYERIDAADPSNKYHLETPTMCKLRKTPENIQPIEQCKVLRKVSMSDVALLQLKDGGVSLKEFALSDPSEKDMLNFLVDFHNIVLSLKMLEVNKLHHIDLKPHNIIYNPKQRLMLMIDFGLMVSGDEMPDFYTSKPISHWNYPPEVYTLRYHENKPRADYKNNRNLKFQRENGTSNLVQYLDFNAYETTKYTMDFENDIKNRDINDVKENSMLTHDVFGAGLALLYVVRKNTDKLSPEIFAEFDRIGKDMMHGAPSARLTPDTLAMQYEMALESTGILRTQGKKIVDGVIVNRNNTEKSESQKIMERVRKIPSISAAKLETIASAEPPPAKKCPPGKELVGKRCLKVCGPGKSRNAATNRCVKNKKECAEGKERNPRTGRCIKKCGPGQVRSEKTRRCIKQKV